MLADYIFAQQLSAPTNPHLRVHRYDRPFLTMCLRYPGPAPDPHRAALRQYGFIGACVSKMYWQSPGSSDS